MISGCSEYALELDWGREGGIETEGRGGEGRKGRLMSSFLSLSSLPFEQSSVLLARS